MAARSMDGTIFAAVFIVAVCLWTGALAQSSSTCTNVLISMSPCLNYIQGNSSTACKRCELAAPVPVRASSPSGAPNSPSGGGSKTVPATEVGTSDGNSAKLSFSLLIFLLFIASSSFLAI
ncbi:hypothetical protein F3Y22_tig00004360pilonHSYRG00003 [Hibiscus syriacus]|uniref:Uncharacterized protein n=1 Tax=Hibiscus syriacus TaxID=106335 RepID=A0A6A3CGQ3_HIBSY|nr:hypothetical protein F3Y22_tig00004360pilonHSYRG00003 [Hibiscus syriacus]